MPKKNETGIKSFVALVEDDRGHQRRERVEARDRVSARVALAEKSLRIIELEERKSWTEIEFGASVPDGQILQFTRQMSAFISAGISVTKALELLAATAKHKRLKSVIEMLHKDISEGESLGTAIRSQGKVFPAYYSAILQSSERSGDMTAAFETLAAYIERDLGSKRAVRSALYYPAILVFIGVAAVFLLTTVVLPRFQVFFASLDAQLPVTTRILLATSSFFATAWLYIILALILAVILVIAAGKVSRGKYIIDAFLLRIPIIGSVLDLIALERFARVLGTLSIAGVPLPDSLDLAAKVVGNSVYSTAVREVRRGVINGQGLSSPMEDTGAFPEAMVQIVRVGEETGRLSQQLEQSSLMYSKEVDYRLKNLTTLLEPLVLLIVGGGVGFVAIALVSAMYGIYNAGQLGS